VRERRTHARGAAHGVGHLLVAPERLDAQPDGLELRAHLHELLHVPARAHEVLGHHLARVLRAPRSVGGAAHGARGGRTICPAFALLRMSATSFFSDASSLVRSRSSSRCALASERWCCRSRSAGVTVRPKSVSCEHNDSQP
jgi:hypothetical protein